MKKLQLTLELTNLADFAHIWFPVPVEGETRDFVFNIPITKIQKDKFGNRIAYFFLKNSSYKNCSCKIRPFEIRTEFPINSHSNKVAPCNYKEQPFEAYIQSSTSICADDKRIIQIVQGLVKGRKSDAEIAKAVFDWVVSYLEYANPIPGLYTSLQALKNKQVDCGGFATLLVALLRANRIPARCVFGWAIASKYGYHAWAEYFDREQRKWTPMDPSVAFLGKRTKLDAGFGFINDKRVIVSVGEDIKLKGKGLVWKTPLLQLPVVVSVSKKFIPRSFNYSLSWKVFSG